jgi:hypothetical protein
MMRAPAPVIEKAAAAPPPMPADAPPAMPMGGAPQGPPGGAGASVDVATPALEVVGRTRGTAAHEALKLTPGQQAAMQNRYEALEGATAANLDLAKQASFDGQALALRQAEERQMDADAAEAARLRRQQELKAAEADIAKTVSDVAKSSIDPERYEKNRSLGNRIWMGIAAGMAGLANPGGPNPILQQINQDVERDIQAQRDAVAAKKEGLQGKETIYGKMLDRYGTEDAAMAATRAALQERSRAELMQLGEKYKGTEAEMMFNEAYAGLQAGQQKEIQAATGMVGGSQGQVLVRTRGGAIVPMSQSEYAKRALADDAKDGDTARSMSAAVATERVKGEYEVQKEQAKAGGDVQKQAAEYGKEVAGLAGLSSSVTEAESALTKSGGGIGFTERVANSAKIENPILRKALFGKEVTQRDQAWQQLEAQSLNVLSGSGVSDKEREKFQEMFRGAGDTASRLETLRLVRNRASAQLEAQKARFSPEAIELYESRGKSKGKAPASLRVEE